MLSPSKGISFRIFFIEQVAQAEPFALDYYPLSKPHSYLILAFQAWLDHYRATGARQISGCRQGCLADHQRGVTSTLAAPWPSANRIPASFRPSPTTSERTRAKLVAAFLGGLQSSLPAVVSWRSEIRRRNRKRHLQCHSCRPGRQGSIRYHNHLQGNKEGAGCVQHLLRGEWAFRSSPACRSSSTLSLMTVSM